VVKKVISDSKAESPTPTHPRWLSYEDAAEHTGASARQLKRAVADGQIGYTKVGLFVRFTAAQLDEWLAANTYTPRRTS